MTRIEAFVPHDVGDRTWGREILIAHTPHYIGKVLHMRAGTKGGLQYHVEKDETFFLFSGSAIVRSDDGTGALVEHVMSPGEAFHIPPGAPHQVEAVEDCVFFEASTPHFDDRVRCEERYGKTCDGGLESTWSR